MLSVSSVMVALARGVTPLCTMFGISRVGVIGQVVD
jgi:hypothetical protein